MKLFLRAATILVALLAIVVLVYAINAALGMRAHARYTGTISGLRLHGPVSILRDDRGVPHILAANDGDLFFAQGYVEGSDRLFQMDLLRRFIRGELAEVFGGAALRTDEEQRAIPIRAIVAAQWTRLDLPTRRILGEFSDGVNAAMRREPLPVEFRLLGYKPRPWTPEDSLAVGMAEVLDLIDDWDAIAPRDAAYRRGGLSLLRERFPLTDPCYDAPVTAGLAGMAPGDRCDRRRLNTLVSELSDRRAPIGSNEWAVGADLTAHKRSLLANDPHLGLGIPGVWYLVDLHSPGYRVAGVTLPGLPSVVLGHNERVAWGATAGTVTSLSVFKPPAHLDEAGWENEQIGVRFGRTITKRFYRTKREFGVTTKDGAFVLVRWVAYEHPSSPATTFLALDRAASTGDAIAVLGKLPQPSLNFALADTGGRAAYVLAGTIPERSRSGPLVSPGHRPGARLSADSVRRTAEGPAVTKRDRLDRQQQDVRLALPAAPQPAVCAAVPRLPDRAAAAFGTRLRRRCVCANADGRALAARARAGTFARARGTPERRRARAVADRLERRDGRCFDDGDGRGSGALTSYRPS